MFFVLLSWISTDTLGQKVAITELKSQLKDKVDLTDKYDLNLKIGKLYQNNLPDSAFYYFQEALTIATKINDPILLADIHYSFGVFERLRGQYNESIEHAIEASKQYAKSNNYLGLIESNTLIGHNYGLKNDYEKSLSYYDESLELSKKVGNKSVIVPTLIGKGNILYFQDKLEEASQLFEEAISISEKYNSVDETRKAGLYNNTGNIYLTQKNYTEAIVKYSNAFSLYSGLNDKFNMSLTAFNLADAFLGINNYDSSLKYCNINLFLAQQLKSNEEIKYAYKGFTNLYEQKKVYDSAYKYYQLHVSYRDSLRDEQYSLEVDELVSKYQSEKKEKELQAANEKVKQGHIIQEQSNRIIYLLEIGGVFLLFVLISVFWLYRRSQKANELIKEQSELITLKNASIDKALFQKDILLKEVHHRVKNNLQIIASLLNLQTMKMDNQVAKKAIEDSKNRVQAIALMHKSLYQDEHLNKVDLKSYVDDLVESQRTLTSNVKGDIVFELDTDSLMLGIDDAVPLGLVISELISNSVKHAFDDSISDPTISISIHQIDQQIKVSYKDNGIGVPDNFSITLGDSLGMEIITALTEQIDGEITILTRKPFAVQIAFKV
jgi:two-component sensor histidine kinase